MWIIGLIPVSLKKKPAKVMPLDRVKALHAAPRSRGAAAVVAGTSGSPLPQRWFIDAVLDHASKTGKSLWR